MLDLKISTVTALGLLLSASAYAGVEHGNGGGAVVCRDANGAITSIELLDFFEQRELLNLERDTSVTGDSYQALAHAYLDKQKGVAPFRATFWGQWIDDFERDAAFLERTEFPPLDDAGDVFPPEGCKVERVVTQTMPMSTRDRRYKIKSELWNALDDVNKAGLALHEVIYREAISYGATDSMATRHMVAYWTAAGAIPELATTESVNATLGNGHFLAGEAMGCSPVLFRFDRPGGEYHPYWNLPVSSRILSYDAQGKAASFHDSLYPGQFRVETPMGPLVGQCDGSDYLNDGTALVARARFEGELRTPQFRIDLASEHARFVAVWAQDRMVVDSDDVGHHFGTATVQDQDILATSVAVRISNGKIISLETPGLDPVTFRLYGVNGEVYTPRDTGQIIKFNDDGMVTSCDGCVVTR